MIQNRLEAHAFYSRIHKKAEEKGPDEVKALMAELGSCDLFYLLVYILNRSDVDNDWLYDRCVDVQYNPNGYLDLWAREHYKSTIITFGKTIQDIINDPEILIAIFSLTRPIAKGFLFQIKTELEDNQSLIELYPDVFYEDPKKNSRRWSLDDGIVVKRKGNAKESTVEAWGLVDAMPTSRHYQIRVYDDIIDEKHVTNPDIVKKAIKAWELSLSLGSTKKLKAYKSINIERYAGTRYHMNDPYKEIMKRNAAIPRLHPGTSNGKPEGNPVLWDRDFMEEKRKKMGSYTFGCQILLNPTADQVQGFKIEWVQYWLPKNWTQFNRYLICDPAGEKKKENDYTVMLVIGLGADQNYYLIDGLRDRLNLTERAKAYIRFHRMYSPLASGYEKYGKDSDKEHIEYVMDEQNYRFEITPLGGPTPKLDRIRKLVPDYEFGRWYLPVRCPFIDYEKKQHDLTQEFVNDELIDFPVASHDDILDCMARIKDEDLGAVFPEKEIDILMMGDQTMAQTEYPLFGGN